MLLAVDHQHGSPPHTREVHIHEQDPRLHRGITPAYAGSTPLHIFPEEPAWDHPRIRGKYHRASIHEAKKGGSPPHTREVREATQCFFNEVRITPRIRGKYDLPRCRKCDHLGSPPHTREVPWLLHGLIPQSRITPAYAGSTTETPPCTCKHRDHPRIRGKY